MPRASLVLRRGVDVVRIPSRLNFVLLVRLLCDRPRLECNQTIEEHHR